MLLAEGLIFLQSPCLVDQHRMPAEGVKRRDEALELTESVPLDEHLEVRRQLQSEVSFDPRPIPSGVDRRFGWRHQSDQVVNRGHGESTSELSSAVPTTRLRRIVRVFGGATCASGMAILRSRRRSRDLAPAASTRRSENRIDYRRDIIRRMHLPR